MVNTACAADTFKKLDLHPPPLRGANWCTLRTLKTNFLEVRARHWPRINHVGVRETERPQRGEPGARQVGVRGVRPHPPI